MRALAKSPAERTASAADVLRELRGDATAPPATPVIRTTPPAARPTTLPAGARTDAPATATVGPGPASRGRRGLVVAVLLALALAAGLGLIWMSGRRPDTAPEAAVAPAAARPAALAPSAPAPTLRPVARTTPPLPRATAAPPRTEPAIDQLKSVLQKVWEEGKKAEERSRQGDDPPARPGGRGKGHGKGKKH
jgi:hypothetical protein